MCLIYGDKFGDIHTMTTVNSRTLAFPALTDNGTSGAAWRRDKPLPQSAALDVNLITHFLS